MRCAFCLFVCGCVLVSGHVCYIYRLASIPVKCMCMCVSVCVCVRERERERERKYASYEHQVVLTFLTFYVKRERELLRVSGLFGVQNTSCDCSIKIINMSRTFLACLIVWMAFCRCPCKLKPKF